MYIYTYMYIYTQGANDVEEEDAQREMEEEGEEDVFCGSEPVFCETDDSGDDELVYIGGSGDLCASVRVGGDASITSSGHGGAVTSTPPIPSKTLAPGALPAPPPAVSGSIPARMSLDVFESCLSLYAGM